METQNAYHITIARASSHNRENVFNILHGTWVHKTTLQHTTYKEESLKAIFPCYEI